MNRPDVLELECFVAVAEQLNFSRAAKQLNLSQPPLTRHVQALEEKIGSRLFDRNTHSVALTDAGRLFLEDARSILSHLDQSAEAIRRAREGETARLRLAFVGALLDERLVRLIQEFRRCHADCQVQVADLSPAAQLAALQSGQLDGGFIGAQPARALKGVGWEIWGREPLLLAVPESHPLARVRSLKWDQLQNLSWVMVSREAAAAFRQQFAELAMKHQLHPRIVQESDRVPAILTMVATGGGVTMVPKGVVHLISRGVCFRELPKPQPVLRHTFAYRTKETPVLLRNFLTLLRSMQKKTT